MLLATFLSLPCAHSVYFCYFIPCCRRTVTIEGFAKCPVVTVECYANAENSSPDCYQLQLYSNIFCLLHYFHIHILAKGVDHSFYKFQVNVRNQLKMNDLTSVLKLMKIFELHAFEGRGGLNFRFYF